MKQKSNSSIETPYFQGRKPTQIGLVVEDVEKAARAYSQFFGLDTLPIHMTEPQEQAKTMYHGRPTPARAKMAFIALEDITIELIEPIDGPSTWRDFLDKNSPGGVHHIAFEVKGLDEQIKLLEQNGAALIQRGQWTGGNGGRYAYLDTVPGLAVTIELLEIF
jgi:methylmalonyl-CoA/ethylmalonyl-CoA epimerase